MTAAIRVIVGAGDVAAGRRIATILEQAGDVELVSGPLDRLTPREHDVLARIADADSNAAIAAALGISTRAVERHVNAIFRKLEIADDGSINRRVRAALAYHGISDSRITPLADDD